VVDLSALTRSCPTASSTHLAMAIDKQSATFFMHLSIFFLFLLVNSRAIKYMEYSENIIDNIFQTFIVTGIVLNTIC